MENTFRVTGNSVYLYANTKTALRYINKPRINQPVLDTDFINIDGRVYFRCQKNHLDSIIIDF
jgi:hypothetical protein